MPDLTRDGRLWFRQGCPVLALLALLVLPAHARPVPEVRRSVFWEPYEQDAQTTGLFHFDGEQPASADKILNLDEPDGGPGRLLEEPGATTGIAAGERTVANAAPMGPTLSLRGACAEAAAVGRFGGGLRLHGRDGMALGTLPGGPRTVEFWVRPEALPAEAATLVAVSSGGGVLTEIAVRLQRDGALVVKWAGAARTVPGAALKVGQWTHLALAWDGAKQAEFRLDGQAMAFPKPLPVAGTEKLTQFALGNGFDGKSGFRGVVDELRVSRELRAFYPWGLHWVDRTGTLDRPEGQPFFRDPRDLLLRLDFDRTLKPTVAPAGMAFAELGPEELGDRLAPERWKRHFTDGVRRESVRLRRGGLEVKYEGTGFALPERGTVAFWVRPLNWNDEVRWNPFAGWPMKHVPLFHMLQGEKSVKAVLALSLVQTPDNDKVRYPIGFHPGRWVHLACAWDGKRNDWFVDGKPWPHWGSLSWTRGDWDASKPLTLVFDRDHSACAIDDFRVYSRPLAPSEVRNLALLHDRREEPKPLPPIEMTMGYNGVIGYVDVALVALHRDYAKAATAHVTVSARGAPPLASHTFDLAKEPAPRGRIETRPLEFGDYEVKAEARDAAGKPLFAASATFQREPPPWWKTRVGVSDKVMPGWTPVRAKDRTLSVILRDIRFSDAGLPASVVSAGDEVLAGPVTLTATVGGKEVPVAPVPGAFRAETKGEVRADFSGRSEGGGIAVDVKGYLEFDGMMWFQVTLSGGAKPEALQMRIPYTEDASRLIHWWSGAHGFRNPRVVHIGAMPPGEGVVFSSLDKARVQLHGNMRGSFIPYVMLTGDRRGMAWFGENDRGWTYSTTTPAVLIQRQGKTVTLVLNIVTEPATLTEPRTFEFGLHPIPVKKLEPGWRMTPGWGVFPDSFCGFNLKGPASTQFYRHPENLDWEMAKRRYDGKDGSQGAWTFDVAGFRRTYGRDPKPRETSVPGLYHTLAYVAGEFPGHTREWGEAFGSQRYAPELIDYFAWIWSEWAKRGLAKGIYFDECWNYPVDSWPSPVTYKRPDGTVQPGFQFRQFREQMKRIRRVFHDHGLAPHLCAHTTHTYFIPYHSFFDTILDGEDFYQEDPNEKRDFMDSWRPDRLRFNNPDKWGLISTWLGWCSGGNKRWGRFPTLAWQNRRAYTAALMVHDIVWTIGMGGQHEVDQAWLRESKLCLDSDVRFVGYWDPATPAAHQHPDLYVSVWKRPGWCAVALASWAANRLQAQVKLDVQAMGFGNVAPEGVTVRDADTTLLSYFDDVTRLKKPGLPNDIDMTKKATDLDGLSLEAPPTVQERKEADPDGKFEWKDGVLRCPVRRHDFRLFEFRSK